MDIFPNSCRGVAFSSNSSCRFQSVKRIRFWIFIAINIAIVGAICPVAVQAQTTSQPHTFFIGGSWQVAVNIPAGYSKKAPAPLLIDLHGYMGSSMSERTFSRLQAAAAKRLVIYAAPDGTVDANGDKFWNASTTCCNFYHSKVDDAAFINSLIKEISSKVSVDPKRVFIFGHSNGAFMAYKFACTYPKSVAAIAGLAGAMDINPAVCKSKIPVNVLAIHGTSDEVINFNGGFMYKNPYTSVQQTIGQWLAIDKCRTPAVMGKPFDIVVDIDGAETTPSVYNCPLSTVELWTVADGLHRPVLDWSFGNRVIDWFLAHPKK